MSNSILKQVPPLETEEEAAEFWLTHDSTEYLDWDKAEMPNLHLLGHVVPVSIPDDDFGQLEELAAIRKKSLAETIGLLVQHGLRELRINPSAML